MVSLTKQISTHDRLYTYLRVFLAEITLILHDVFLLTFIIQQDFL